MIQKIQRLLISSFRWRLFINIIVAYFIAFLCDLALMIILQHINIFHLSYEWLYILAFFISLLIFLVTFSDLMNITLKYIDVLSGTIQRVTAGDYEVEAPIKYDDELGLLAANINALAKTLSDKEKESEILKENERMAYDAERNAEKQKK